MRFAEQTLAAIRHHDVLGKEQFDGHRPLGKKMLGLVDRTPSPRAISRFKRYLRSMTVPISHAPTTVDASTLAAAKERGERARRKSAETEGLLRRRWSTSRPPCVSLASILRLCAAREAE
jgi:hypothetical protein